MAEGGNEPELGGYDYEFTSRVPEDWECLVCHLAMKDPVQIVGCGHRLCNICMESLLRFPSPTCPADRQPLSRDKIFPDAACHRKILDLTVKCSHLGCSWTGELRAVEKHQSECPFKVVKCPNSGCTKKLTLRDLHGHMAFECFWRKINCDYCQDSFIVNQKQEHFGVCRKFPVQCTNNCGLRDIPREKLEAHVRNECPATKVHCEYKNLGCEEVFPRSDAKSHSQTQVECHLNLALRGLEATQLQVHELISLVKDQSQQMEQMKAKLQEQSKQIERHEQIIEICSPSFEWKIPDFQVILERALIEEQTRSSQMFYLFKSGYRYLLEMKVESNQKFNTMNTWLRRMFERNGLSLYIKVVPGEFDRSLSWPCKEKVRITLIDQETCRDNRVNISRVIDFEKSEKPCTRPVAETTHEYRFILYEDRDTLQTRSYIKNDTILIMVSKE